ncbi:chromatin assembly factor 1 subunit A-domain-containing protein [Pisolithus orientalis]|uniref:chromatin assembly factor 1 subunit A-domain-containing protein n=1 Tax=Pisolithus orientalis TaxID=936130 RepID=UPI002223FB42|nr:chromatin assembly factor 1 subunit A-domain-containing protein [Pisolithus orientalis]KAI6028453.1 chromatin assembly factor 1 subunit A-domain-containing protein [Pisolithus orientalis]
MQGKSSWTIVKFREMLDKRANNVAQPLTNIPDENKPVIVKLAQESDKSAAALAKQMRSTLLPGQGEVDEAYRTALESCLPLSAIEHAIKTVMKRVNYGLDCHSVQKPPATICVWRWEVQDAFKDWLPKSARETAEARMTERVQASKICSAIFEHLPKAQQDAILDPKGTSKSPTKDAGLPSGHASANLNSAEKQNIPHGTTSIPTGDDTVSNTDVPISTTHSDKEKEERKAARVEKERKQKEAQDKSRSILANFFGKAKVSSQDSPAKDSIAAANPLAIENDFQRTFKPFVLKKDAECAPHNWFLESKGTRPGTKGRGITHDDAIVIDDTDAASDTQAYAPSSDEPAAHSEPAELQNILKLFRRRSLMRPARRSVSSFKTSNPRTVRDVMAQLGEAEIAGDPSQVRHLLKILSDRKLLPAKVLIFNEDARPGYYGTWTRNSRIVGPRAPFAKDFLARDYGYDSGEEWEDEDPAQADDVVDDGEEDDADGDEPDSDLDSWLVDDEEVQTPSIPDSRDPSPSSAANLIMPPPKRKAEDPGKQQEKKRKVVVQLVPYAKGPCWESAIGKCEYEPFEAYRIQLFNDAPHPINPFTFVSAAAEERQNVKVDLNPPDKVAVDPSLGAASHGKRAGITQTRKAPPFPDEHLGALLAKVTTLATPSLNFLVESIYQDLRIHKVKKNAIEAKVREVCEKSKDKVWVVREAIPVQHGIIQRP